MYWFSVFFYLPLFITFTFSSCSSAGLTRSHHVSAPADMLFPISTFLGNFYKIIFTVSTIIFETTFYSSQLSSASLTASQAICWVLTVLTPPSPSFTTLAFLFSTQPNFLWFLQFFHNVQVKTIFDPQSLPLPFLPQENHNILTAKLARLPQTIFEAKITVFDFLSQPGLHP